MLLLSFLYQAGVFLRNQAYNFHLLPIRTVPVPVVSVGNIVAGGTGKTPLVHFLAHELAKKNRVAILSRGYKSLAEHQKTPTRVRPDTMTAHEVGDEPLWLAQKLPKVDVWVSKYRYRSALQAIQNGAEILLLDDGFQHRALHRDFEIVVVAGSHPQFFLPYGKLRDFPSRLAQADLLVMMEKSSTTNCVIFGRTTPMKLHREKVALFCAIANPERFLTQAQATGAEIKISLIKADHDLFSQEELQFLYTRYPVDCLLCTEKDFVKIPQNRHHLPIVALPLELHIEEGKERWEQLIQQIQSKAANHGL